jgi:hypothetical protein
MLRRLVPSLALLALSCGTTATSDDEVAVTETAASETSVTETSASETSASETSAAETTETSTETTETSTETTETSTETTETSTGTTETMGCSIGRSAGCCFGDGECCPCILGCDPDTSFEQDPETDALIACACAADACQAECANECAGNGIGGDCEPCVEQLGMNVCMAEYLACQP